jgi:hypothetical protein
MNRRSAAIAGTAIVAVLAVIWILSTSTTKSDDKPKSALLEVIDVQGVCWEDHVGKRDNYAGQIVRWQKLDTKQITAYGFVNNGFSVERSLDEAKHPTTYHTPFMIELTNIDVDTDQPKWEVHGVSDHGANQQGYDSTCQLDVVKRGDKVSEMLLAPTGNPK